MFDAFNFGRMTQQDIAVFNGKKRGFDGVEAEESPYGYTQPLTHFPTHLSVAEPYGNSSTLSFQKDK